MNEFSIVIPCISSIESLNHFIDELAILIMSNPSDVDIIVVVNESVPHVSKLVHHVHGKYPWLKFEVLQRKGFSRSFGALTRFGIAYSSSQYVLIIPSFKENDTRIIPKMLNKIREGAQVVQAARYTTPESIKNIPFRFRLYQNIYRILLRILLGLKVNDSTYGFKIFDRIFIQALGLNQNGYSICPEIVIKTLLAKGRVEYIPSTPKSTPFNHDFKLYKEGVGYLWVLTRGFLHRIGILWF